MESVLHRRALPHRGGIEPPSSQLRMSEYTGARLCQLSYRVMRELPDSRKDDRNIYENMTLPHPALR